jgi:hypothetical protein
MDIGVGTPVWFRTHAAVVVEGPDEGGQFLVEFVADDGGLDTAWCSPGDGSLSPRDA